jgi:heterogeneous nuclear ribonucleoprotein F/H
MSILADHTRRNTGHVYVQFVSNEEEKRALNKHMDKTGHRCVKVHAFSRALIRQRWGGGGKGG